MKKYLAIFLALFLSNAQAEDLFYSPYTSSASGTEIANVIFAGPSSGSAAAPTFRSLVGADLPNPSATTLGGTESIAAVSHNFLTSISTSGVPAQAQPAFTDISGIASSAQILPTSTYGSLPTCNSGEVGIYYSVTNIGTGGSIWYCANNSGTYYWKPQGGVVNLYYLTTQATTGSTTGNVTLGTYTLPANIMSNGGMLRFESTYHGTTTGARDLFYYLSWGGNNIQLMAVGLSGTVNGYSRVNLSNNNSSSAQLVGGMGANSTNGAFQYNVTSYTVNTASAVTINLIGATQNSADIFYIDSASIDLVLN